MSPLRLSCTLALGVLVGLSASCSRTNGGGVGDDDDASSGTCIMPGHLEGQWRFQYDDADITLDIDSDGASEFTVADEGDFLGTSTAPIGDDICDMLFDVRFDYGPDEPPTDMRFTLRKTNGSGLNLPIPANFDVCDAPPSALDGRWELTLEEIGGEGDPVVIILDLNDDDASLTELYDGEVEELTDCAVGGTICDLTIACDDVVAMRLERL